MYYLNEPILHSYLSQPRIHDWSKMVWEEKIREGVLPMRAWARHGSPEVGFWLHTGEVDLAREVDIECKSDWCSVIWWGSAYIPVGWESIVQFRWLAKVTRNLSIDSCSKTWQGWSPPAKVEIHHRDENSRNNCCQNLQGSCTGKKRVLSWKTDATHCATNTHHLLGCFPYWLGISTIPVSLPRAQHEDPLS